MERVISNIDPSMVHLNKEQLIELQKRRNELQKLYPNAKQCPQCLFGPLINEACDDMQAHAHEANK